MTGAAGRERIVAVAPIRSFRNGKTRLASVLDQDARESLLRQTAAGVVAAARHSGCVESVLVIIPDAEALAWASGLGPGVMPVGQLESSPGLNGAIDQGRAWALAAGADAVLSLFADLPFLAASDIRGLAARPETIVLGPDRRGEGTNALLLRLAGPAAAFPFAFGEQSLARHLDEAARLGLDAGIHRTAGIAFDLDTPADWTDFLAAQTEWRTDAASMLIPCGAGVA